MKFTYAKFPEGEYKVGQEVALTNVSEIEITDPAMRHPFINSDPDAETCVLCDKPRSAGRHQ